MAEYIFYTTEGFTQDPNGNNVENCQVLGMANGENKFEALKKLLKENTWIEEHGFDSHKIICQELAPDGNCLVL